MAELPKVGRDRSAFRFLSGRSGGNGSTGKSVTEACIHDLLGIWEMKIHRASTPFPQ